MEQKACEAIAVTTKDYHSNETKHMSEKLSLPPKNSSIPGFRFLVDDDGDLRLSAVQRHRGRIIEENRDLMQALNRFRNAQIDENRSEWYLYLRPGSDDVYRMFFNWVKKQNLGDIGNTIVAEFEEYEQFYREHVKKRLKAIQRTGKVTFADLKQIFVPGAKCVVLTPYDDELQGGIISSVSTQSFWGQYYLNIEFKSITPDDGKIFMCERYAKIPYFSGFREMKELSVRIPTSEETDALMSRGLLYKQYLEKPHYLQYDGDMFRKNWMFLNEYRSDGRVMIDCTSFSKFEPNYSNYHENEEVDLSGEMLFTCPPVIFGYSMRLKMWGEFHIKDLSPIEFRENAFDLLVMEQDRKEIMKALIETKTDFTDLINGKGGGLIFLLHGTPGVGKTLTAEAVSEVLKQPLYSVSVGELGTSVDELETNLRNILELATVWNAILLIDEADIFLEKRTASDITRNAMVAIFLRMLEYYSGVLFLTTNRVKSIDPAFESRISLPIEYSALHPSVREQIWRNLLAAQNIEYDIDDSDFRGLSTYENNGREIKSIIRLSMTLAQSRKERLCMDHLNRIIKLRSRSVCSD